MVGLLCRGLHLHTTCITRDIQLLDVQMPWWQCVHHVAVPSSSTMAQALTLKFFTNSADSCDSVSLKSALSAHCSAGCSSTAGTPGQEVGTCTHTHTHTHTHTGKQAAHWSVTSSPLLLLLHGQVIPDTPFGAKQSSWGTGVIVRIGIHVIELIRQ
jgi:hypothetical protein